MKVRYLLDTHVLLWWLTEPKNLSKEQLRVLRDCERRSEPVALSTVTLMEIAVVFGRGSRRKDAFDAERVLDQIESADTLELIPVDIGVAREIAALGDSLRDPIDRAILATARVHNLRLITSDERLIASGLVRTIA